MAAGPSFYEHHHKCIILGMETEGSKQFFKKHPGWAEMRP
jgi:hypothetical protein